MGWAKFDDAYSDHPKVVAAGPLAELLDTRAIMFCARHETDGHVRAAQLSRLGIGIKSPKIQAQRLVDVGRWEPDGGGDGWWVHDFLDYNPSRAQKNAEREAARERMRSARVAKNNKRSSGEQQPKFAGGSGNPDPAPPPKTSKPKKHKRPSGFEPNEANRKFAAEHGLDLAAEVEAFCIDRDAKGVTYVDWQLGLRTWLGNQVKWRKERGTPSNVRTLPRTQQVSDFSQVSGEFRP